MNMATMQAAAVAWSAQISETQDTNAISVRHMGSRVHRVRCAVMGWVVMMLMERVRKRWGDGGSGLENALGSGLERWT